MLVVLNINTHKKETIMRKIIVSTYMTLDGVIENPMWTMPYWSDDIAAFQTNDLFSSDALLLGRETYEGFAEAWSSRAGMAYKV